MTLSRYDEWNGTFSTDSDRSANCGLLPSVIRRRPTSERSGIRARASGRRQRGIGAPFTTVEVMDVRLVARDLAATMQASWCGASGTAAAKRQQAWRPWWSDTDGNGTSDSCPLCEGFYQDLVATDGPSLVPGIGPLGGVEQRMCQLPDTTEHTCWYVDPDRSQAATAWKLQPLDGGSSTVAPTPLSAPFYVIERSGLEERYWLATTPGTPSTSGASARSVPTPAADRAADLGHHLGVRRRPLRSHHAPRGRCDLLPAEGVHLTQGRQPERADAGGG